MNLPANHRLMPLAARMERGWMASHDEGIDPGDANATPEKAPTFRIVLENRYQWGPPWYAPTWGVVYFLYNYQDSVDGRYVYRSAFQEFIDASGGRVGKGAVENFVEVVLGNPQPPIKGVERPADAPELKLPRTVEALDEVWKEWTLRLRDEQQGALDVSRPYQEWGRYAIMNGDFAVAQDHFEKGLVEDPTNIELLIEFSELLSKHLDNPDRASRLVLEAVYNLEQQEPIDEDKLKECERILSKLDKTLRTLTRVQDDMAAVARGIVQRYESNGLNSMVLDVSWRLGSDLGVGDLFDVYERALRTSGKNLHIWQLAYNEDNLDGWNTQSTNPVFRANGSLLDGEFGEFQEDDYTFQALTLDTVTSGDFSMQADVQANRGEVNFCGFVFGQKDPQSFHGLLLFPGKDSTGETSDTGYADLMSNLGGDMKTWRHVPVDTKPKEGRSSAGRWVDLRLDVIGVHVDVFFDGELIATHEFPSKDVLRGSFGLLMGPGAARFKNIRYLARDARDPGARIERDMRQEELARKGEPVGGSYLGLVPPFPKVRRWVSGEERESWEEKGHVLQLLVMWSLHQNDLVRIDQWLSDLHERTRDVGLEIVSICSPNDDAGVEAYLKEHEWPGSVAVDNRDEGTFGIGDTNEMFYTRRFSLPRLVLLDLDHTVAWEGDPGFELGWEYDPELESFLAVPLEDLVEKRRLRKLLRWRKRWPAAWEQLREGDLEAALPTLQQATDFEPRFAPQAGQAASALGALSSALDSLESTAASLQREGAEPALAELIAWAPLLEREVDKKQLKNLKRVIDSKSAKAWRSALKAVERYQKRKKDTPAEKADDLVAGVDGEGRFCEAFHAELLAARDAEDWEVFEQLVAGASTRPRAWLVRDYFGWR